MIAKDRPICIMQYEPPRDVLERYRDPFREFGKWTMSEETEREARWDDTGRTLLDVEYDFETACEALFEKQINNDRYYVKCMEPAVYYVSIAHGGLSNGPNRFCNYHRPKVVEAL
jgi:hypothetical protein